MLPTLRHQWNGAPFISGAARNPASRSTSHEWDKDKAESVKTVEGALVASRNRDSIEGGGGGDPRKCVEGPCHVSNFSPCIRNAITYGVLRRSRVGLDEFRDSRDNRIACPRSPPGPPPPDPSVPARAKTRAPQLLRELECGINMEVADRSILLGDVAHGR